jgi:hypothetical protein
MVVPNAAFIGKCQNLPVNAPNAYSPCISSLHSLLAGRNSGVIHTLIYKSVVAFSNPFISVRSLEYHMISLAEKIARLETELQTLGEKQNAEGTDREERLLLAEEIIAKEQRLKIYLESQKGKFTSPISVVLSHSYR